MADALEHRGPDGQGYLLWSAETGIRAAVDVDKQGVDLDATSSTHASVGLAHRRLSILDLSEDAHQPMVDPTGRYALTYNGELYNYIELRAELEGHGHRFRSSGDTEVLLRSYIQWGPECVDRFVGMWALVILDLHRQALFVSRDRFGIKPLFYSVADGGIWFASEIKGLLALPRMTREPDEVTLATYLVDGVVDHSDRTFFDGIRQVPAAHSAVIPLAERASPPRLGRYWSLPTVQEQACNAAAIDDYRTRFVEAVATHARSDVPVGTCLSGGIDSSAIVGAAAELRRSGTIPGYAHEAFGYVPDDEAVSEESFMAQVVAHTHVRMHYVRVARRRFTSAIPTIIRQQDEPFGSASIGAQWFVFERARGAGLKVMLDGQGADEVLAGYRLYTRLFGEMLLRRGRALQYARFARAHRIRFDAPPLRPPEVLGSLAGALPVGLRRRLRGARQPPRAPLPEWVNDSEIRPAHISGLALRPDAPRTLNELLAQQTASTGLPALLRYEDRNSMAHSIEARVPFLDHRLVEAAFHLQDACKLNGATSKYVLREALKGTIPESVRTRVDKVGFRADPGITAALAADPDLGLLEAPTPLEQRWLDRDGVQRLIGQAQRSVDAEFALWRVINIKLWLRAFWR